MTIAAGPRPFDVDPVAAVHALATVRRGSRQPPRARLAVVVPPGLDGGRRAGEGRRARRSRPDTSRSAACSQPGCTRWTAPPSTATGTSTPPSAGRAGSACPCRCSASRHDGSREPFVSGIVNATSMAFDPDGRLCVTSRFDGSGLSHRRRTARPRRIASDLGVACGLAFAPDGSYVRRRPHRHGLPGQRRRARVAVRDAAAERRRVPPRDRAATRSCT